MEQIMNSLVTLSTADMPDSLQCQCWLYTAQYYETSVLQHN